ncbi:MAG: nickel pincer cofactor biosynthesis protein LarB [Verrucomicrobiota bacterium]
MKPEGTENKETVPKSANEIPFATVDLERAKRCGSPEVIFGQGKSSKHIAAISKKLLEANQPVLITRVGKDTYKSLIKKCPKAVFHEAARCITIQTSKKSAANTSNSLKPIICIAAAGTSDLPVAEEAAVTAAFYGNEVTRVYDVGIAGVHRILSKQDVLSSAQVIIAVAGMEGALPSVIAGLVKIPVIAVPTSIGYGTHFGGLAALLGMLNSCGSGVTVVNIDNGFGAAYAANQITSLINK